jgi:hypothetical protein
MKARAPTHVAACMGRASCFFDPPTFFFSRQKKRRSCEPEAGSSSIVTVRLSGSPPRFAIKLSNFKFVVFTIKFINFFCAVINISNRLEA